MSDIIYKWVLGFHFNKDFSKVILIKKKRGPSFNIGRWNGIGGKIEESETPEEAIEREAREEAAVTADKWIRFLDYITKEGVVVCFFSLGKRGDISFTQCEDEDLKVFDTLNIDSPAVNIKWMIEMAKSVAGENFPAKMFFVKD